MNLQNQKKKKLLQTTYAHKERAWKWSIQYHCRKRPSKPTKMSETKGGQRLQHFFLKMREKKMPLHEILKGKRTKLYGVEQDTMQRMRMEHTNIDIYFCLVVNNDNNKK